MIIGNPDFDGISFLSGFFQKSYRKIMLREWKSVDISKDIHFLETPTKSEDHLLLEKQQKLENIVKMTADILLGIQVSCEQ